ncbi:MAG: ribonucleoside-diphosphate reductase subunit alpha [Lagierella massiliensis]|nr:ribonucleoside-diphosphate reductase subunit alpha [Lagierella massiliensis]
MKIKKRSGDLVDFDKQKIVIAMKKAFISVSKPVDDEKLQTMANQVCEKIKSDFSKNHIVTVEEIQDLVEIVLIENKYIEVVKSYILYRAGHHRMRKTLEDFSEFFEDEVLEIMKGIQEDFKEDVYDLQFLFKKFSSFLSKNMDDEKYLEVLVKASSELTSKEAPRWEYISARFLAYSIEKSIKKQEKKLEITSFYEKIKYLTEKGLYGKYILENYSEEEVNELSNYMDSSRNHRFNFSGLDLLKSRYLIKTGDGVILEKIQEMFMGISMHLAMKEENKLHYAKKFYDILSKLQVTMATPTMSNARKPYHQLSSCFIDTVDDSLDGIYRSITNFSQVSKHGGGMGLYFGKVRAIGSDIRGFKGVAGGVIRWIKLANDTAVAVDQLGVRQGACAVYLDIWHRDVPEFLQLKTNNGDDRMKAHDIFPAVSYPNYFWELARDDINANWYMFCPHEVKTIKGFSLEDYHGEEWVRKYHECIKDPRLEKRVMSVKDLVRLILKSVIETGTPFVFNRDAVNKYNPNGHKGMIYSSNLCTEICQNTSAIESVSTEVVEVDGEEIVVEKTKPGDFVVCNLASLVLGNIDLKNELEDVVSTVVRALDNVIDLNYYPVEYAKITNKKYRSLGLGTSGYHHAMVKEGIMFSSEEHIKWADKLYEDINYYAVKASAKIAAEKGAYSYFEGSDWQTGQYFEKRDYSSPRWTKLREEISKTGMRNGYLMAVAPTGSTSIIAGTTAAVDPVMMRYFLEEKKGQILPRVAPDLNPQNFWTYENAHEVDGDWIIRSAGARQRHIDQAQSVNIYITSEYKMSTLLGLYIKACEEEVKTIYYVRNKALEVKECDSCSA